MKMLVPVISKLTKSTEILIERVLPVSGEITAAADAEVVPYDHLGFCDFSQRSFKLAKSFRPSKFKKDGQFYYYNLPLGVSDKQKIDAPYNGSLFKLPSGEYEFKEESKKYVLLAGVWGKIVKIKPNESVLIKSNMTDINLVAATKNDFAGELVVFPNPSHLLEKFYLEGFASGAASGKIVYVGNNVRIDLLKEAQKYGVGGIVAGSANLETFRYAQKAGISFGLFGGFGDIPTPMDVYTVLTNVANRYVFFQGDRNLLRIPTPPTEAITTLENNSLTKDTVLVQIQKGHHVFVLQRPYFGKTGIVDSVSESSIFVKFSINEKPVEIFLPNFFVLRS